MSVYDILESVSAITNCKVCDVLPDGQLSVDVYEALTEALEDGLINCVDGYLYITAKGRAHYLEHRESLRGG